MGGTTTKEVIPMRPILVPLVAIGSAVGLAFTASAHPGFHPRHHRPPRTVLAFHSMFGVDGAFVEEENAIRGVPGDEDPWAIDRAIGRLDSNGNLMILVRGLVFEDNDDPDLIGKNDEAEFRGLVSCLTEENGEVEEANVTTEGFPATESGDSFIHAKIELPNPCVAPIVMVLAGSEDKWFSITGIEIGDED
jgi:hypothetical protein